MRDTLSVLKGRSTDNLSSKSTVELSLAGVGATLANLHDMLEATLRSVETARVAATKKYYADIERRNEAYADRVLGKSPGSDNE